MDELHFTKRYNKLLYDIEHFLLIVSPSFTPRSEGKLPSLSFAALLLP